MSFFKNPAPPESGASKNGGKAASEGIIEEMLALAESCINQGKPERAFELYQKAVDLSGNVTAKYNLGTLYATGRGTGQDFLQAAYWFHQAALSGDSQAEKLRSKCMMDYIHKDFDAKTPQVLYHEMLRFIGQLYPRGDSRDIAAKQLDALADFHMNRQEYADAAKLFRAAAEFGDDGTAQNMLGVLYNTGTGLKQNDLAALYWFDRAVGHQIALARTDRDGIFNAYMKNSSPAEFYGIIMTLSRWCSQGMKDIPQDGEKADCWRLRAERRQMLE